MPPKKSKKGKKVKKLYVDGNLVQDALGNSMMQRLGLNLSYADSQGDQSFVSMSLETPRDLLDDSRNDEYGGSQSYREHSTSKQLNILDELKEEEEMKHEEEKEEQHQQYIDQQEVIQQIQHMKEESILKQHMKNGEKSTTISNPSLQAQVDDDNDDYIDMQQRQQEEEQARIRENERGRINLVIDSIAQKLKEFEQHFNQINTSNNLNYDNIDNHYKEVIRLSQDLSQLNVPKNLIKAEFKVSFADLEDELSRIDKEKNEFLHQIMKRVEQITDALNHRQEEEDQALRTAEELLKREEFDNALQELEKVLYHKLQEKFQLATKITQRQNEKEDEERRRRLEEEERLQRIEEERIRQEQEILRQQQQEKEGLEREAQEKLIRERQEQEKLERELEHQRFLEEQRQQAIRDENDRKLREDQERREREKQERLEEQQRQEQERQRLENEAAEQRKRELALQNYQEEQRRLEEERNKTKPSNYDSSNEQSQQRLNTSQDSHQRSKQRKDDDEGSGSGGVVLLTAILGIAIAGGIFGYKFYLKKL